MGAARELAARTREPNENACSLARARASKRDSGEGTCVMMWRAIPVTRKLRFQCRETIPYTLLRRHFLALSACDRPERLPLSRIP